jgi:hypothetical protein
MVKKGRHSSNEALDGSQDSDLKMNAVCEGRVPVPADEWLGAESHMPNLSYELRHRDRRGRGISGIWMVGALLVSGIAIGSLATLLVARSRNGA